MLSQKTKDDLDRYWVGVFGSSYYFRKHEWEKHGTCYPGNSQENYFYMAVTLSAYDYNFISSWKKAGIVPSDNVGYSLDQLAKHGEKGAVFACVTSNGRQMLASVYLCLDSELYA